MRAVWKFCIFLSVLLILFWVSAIARQRLFRWRAERLLADVQSLEVLHSTWPDAHRLITRWGGWGRYYGACTSTDCDYIIWLDDTIPWEYSLPWDDPSSSYEGNGHRLARTLDLIGLRSSAVSASFRVSKGVITSKSFGAMVATPFRYWNDPQYDVHSELSATAFEGPHLHGINPGYYSGDIYSLSKLGPHGNLVAFSTPQAPLQRRQEMMAFHLSCISQWVPCLHLEQILTKAALEAENRSNNREQGIREGHDPESQVPVCDAREFELLARESREVWIATVEARREADSSSNDLKETDYQAFVFPQVFLKKTKSSVPLKEAIRAVNYSSSVFAAAKHSQVLIFGDVEDDLPKPRLPFFQLENCSLAPATPENLAAVHRGIKEDYDPRAF